MKYWLGLAVVIIIVFAFIRSPQSIPTTLPSPQPQNAPSLSGLVVTANDLDYHVYLQKIDDEESLMLIPNFSQKKLSQTIMQENKCLFGTNGGFYTNDSKALGLFYANGQYLNKTTHNQSFFNGFVVHTVTGKLDIVSEVPDNTQNNFDFLFQSGPFFTPQTNLSIKDDEPARRVLLAKTESGAFYFLALTETDNSNSGPYLEELPELLKQLPIQFSIAINLDGGTASAFYQENGIILSELVAVGSFLCQQ